MLNQDNFTGGNNLIVGGDPSSQAFEPGQQYQSVQELEARILEQTRISGAALKAVEDSENKFRNTVRQAPVGIAILRGEDMFVEMANDAYLALVDKTKESFVGKSLYDSLPEVKDRVSPLLLNVLRSGESFYANDFEASLHRFGKEEKAFFNLVYSPLRDDDQTLSGVMVVATEVTEQVRAKTALKQKDDQFRKLVSQSPIAMTIFRGPDFIIELANETLLKNIWRKQWSAVEGQKLLEVFPELNDQKFPSLLREVLNNGITHRESEALATVNSDDGSKQYYLDFEYSPLTELDGVISGVMVTANDVTEKVLARKSKEESDKRYRELIEMMPVAVFTVDRDGYIDLFNLAATQLWGRTPRKGIDRWTGAQRYYDLEGNIIANEDLPVAQSMKENRAISTEVLLERPDGDIRHVIAHPQPLHDEDGNVIGAMKVVIDITQRKQAEKALASSEARFRVLANSMPQLIWTANSEGLLNYFSQSVYEYAGLTEDQIFKEGWLAIIHPEDRQANLSLWNEAVSTGKDFHFEHRFRRHDGEYRWQLSRAVPQKDVAGNIQMWVGTSTDIHDRRLFLDELKEKVEERTKALTITNENLMRSNAELAQFAYVASHDLQEPLRKIQTFVSRILEMDYGSLSDRSKDYFDRIHRASNRTQQLIIDLLSFSRTTTADEHFQSTDLEELLDKVKEDVVENNEHIRVTIVNEPLPVLPLIDFKLNNYSATC